VKDIPAATFGMNIDVISFRFRLMGKTRNIGSYIYYRTTS